MEKGPEICANSQKHTRRSQRFTDELGGIASVRLIADLLFEPNSDFLCKKFGRSQEEKDEETERAASLPESVLVPDITTVKFIQLVGIRMWKLGSIGDCLNLTVCLISDNCLTNIAGLKQCRELVKLDLHSNQLRRVPSGKFWANMKKLEFLNLHDNPLAFKEAIEAISQCERLIALSMYNTPLSLTPNYRQYVVETISTLKVLDWQVITGIEFMHWKCPELKRRPKLTVDICPEQLSCVSLSEALQSVSSLKMKINRVQAKYCPVLIIQRLIRGILVRRRIICLGLLHKSVSSVKDKPLTPTGTVSSRIESDYRNVDNNNSGSKTDELETIKLCIIRTPKPYSEIFLDDTATDKMTELRNKNLLRDNINICASIRNADRNYHTMLREQQKAKKMPYKHTDYLKKIQHKIYRYSLASGIIALEQKLHNLKIAREYDRTDGKEIQRVALKNERLVYDHLESDPERKIHVSEESRYDDIGDGLKRRMTREGDVEIHVKHRKLRVLWNRRKKTHRAELSFVSKINSQMTAFSNLLRRSQIRNWKKKQFEERYAIARAKAEAEKMVVERRKVSYSQTAKFVAIANLVENKMFRSGLLVKSEEAKQSARERVRILRKTNDISQQIRPDLLTSKVQLPNF